MTIKKRTIDTITIGTDGSTGTGAKSVGLGATYGSVRKIEVKGDDTNVDTTTTLVVTDADGRLVFTKGATDFGGDDSTSKQTEQSYSTVGLGMYLVPDEAETFDRAGEVSAANTGEAGAGIMARSPLTVTFGSGTDGDVFRVHVFVEV